MGGAAAEGENSAKSASFLMKAKVPFLCRDYLGFYSDNTVICVDIETGLVNHPVCILVRLHCCAYCCRNTAIGVGKGKAPSRIDTVINIHSLNRHPILKSLFYLPFKC